MEASAQGGHGAAAASLTDPACTPGTAEFRAAKKENDGILAVYRKYLAKLVANGVSLSTKASPSVPLQ
jgi:hypothetical protein